MSETLSSATGPPADPLADQLRLAITTAFLPRGDRDLTDELRGAVCAYVQEQRAKGVRAEEVVIAVKRIIDLTDHRSTRNLERRAVTERVVTWCIAEYYRAD
jgi:hypothetical protein